jgi:hypothetical protein
MTTKVASLPTRKLHASFWHYDGNHQNGHDCERRDPHSLGLSVIAAMAYLSEREYRVCGVSLDNVVVIHGKGDGFGHEIKVIATKKQWDAMKQFIQENPEYC